MLVIRTGIHRILVRIANREDQDQTALFCAVCLSLFWLATCVRNFRTSTIGSDSKAITDIFLIYLLLYSTVSKNENDTKHCNQSKNQLHAINVCAFPEVFLHSIFHRSVASCEKLFTNGFFLLV